MNYGSIDWLPSWLLDFAFGLGLTVHINQPHILVRDLLLTDNSLLNLNQHTGVYVVTQWLVVLNLWHYYALLLLLQLHLYLLDLPILREYYLRSQLWSHLFCLNSFFWDNYLFLSSEIYLFMYSLMYNLLIS